MILPVSIQAAMMENAPPFADILEAAGSLSLEEQEVLVEILNRRLIERRARGVGRGRRGRRSPIPARRVPPGPAG